MLERAGSDPSCLLMLPETHTALQERPLGCPLPSVPGHPEESPMRQREGPCEHTVAPRAGLSPTVVIDSDLRTWALSHMHPTPPVCSASVLISSPLCGIPLGDSLP